MKDYLRLGAFLVAAALAGCDSARLFGAHPEPETPGRGEFAWPRLVDTPDAPAKGEYTDAVPDPARGAAAGAALQLAAREAEARAASLAGPVLTEEEHRRLAAGR